MDINKLKGKIVEKGKRHYECAEAIGITPASFSNKLNGTTSFTIIEANHLAEYLGLTIDEKVAIFMP